MNLKNLSKYIELLKLQNQNNYHEFVKNYDTAKLLKNEPLYINDKGYGNTELEETSIEAVTKPTEMHGNLAQKYSLHKLSCGENVLARTLSVLNWLTENTFYNGAQIINLKDNSLDILEYSFRKNFKKAINCRFKAIVFADCLTAVGIKAYPVCMISSKFKEGCHFTCHVYIDELNKWCAFDPSFGCYFTDENSNMLDLFEIRDIFLKGNKPVICGYNFNGTDECVDVYSDAFLKLCLSNLSTWNDSSTDKRSSKKWKYKKKFQSKIPR